MKPAVSFAAVFAVHLIAAQAAEGTDVLVHSRASGFGVEYLQAVRALPSHARTARKLARCRAEVFSDSNVSVVTLDVTGAVRIARAGLLRRDAFQGAGQEKRSFFLTLSFS